MFMQHFDAMDYSAQSLAELDTSLATATALERFQEAASLKKKIDDLNAGDAVEEVLEVRQCVTHAQGHRAFYCLDSECARPSLLWTVHGAMSKHDNLGALVVFEHCNTHISQQNWSCTVLFESQAFVITYVFGWRRHVNAV